jgi:transglutaminase/protease-like cytokinesis protein 3
MEGRGDSEGFSLTYKLLCDQAGLSCYVVSGLLNGFPHFWNIVTIAEKSYHIDAFSEDPTVHFCSDTDLIKQGYNWNPEDHPPCVERLNKKF